MFKKNRPAIDYVVVGLGNYGEKYKNTRHNVGFMAIDYICRELNLEKGKSRWSGNVWNTTIDGKRVLLVKPHTFMNRSGDCVAKITSYFKISPERVIVIYDDTALDTGRMRIRPKGTDGGHNGIKSIIHALASYDIPRIRVGITKPSGQFVLADWVLGDFRATERKKIDAALPDVYDAIRLMLDEKIAEAMNKYNTAPASQEA